MKYLLLAGLLMAQLASAKSLKMTTYNVGLAHSFVHHAEERLPHIVEALKKADTDVICLQEAWTKKDRKKIFKSLKKEYPYSFFTEIKNVKSKKRPTCRIKELFGEDKFVACMQKNCKGLEGDEFTDCIIDTCGPALRNLKDSNRECATSLMAQVGKSSLMGLLTVINPFKRAGLFAYKGSTGVMLFSKYPLKNKKVLDFSQMSTLNKRTALTADMEVEGKLHKVVCTHLTADLEKTVPYTGLFQTWGNENLMQIEKLLEDYNKSKTPVYIMGDFNCSLGDSSIGIDPELEKSCQRLSQSTFVDALVKLSPSCTYCADNLLNEGETKNHIIDHVYVRNARPVKAEVVFKEKIKVEKDGQMVDTNLSDHYGVTVEVESK